MVILIGDKKGEKEPHPNDFLFSPYQFSLERKEVQK